MNHKKHHTHRTDSVDASRRTAVKALVTLFAGTLSARTIAAALSRSTQAKDTTEQQGLIFNHEHFALVKTMAELIIPKTDTPGAIEADVHGFMDKQIAQCFTQSERNTFMQQINTIDPAARKRYQQRFINCTRQQQTTFLRNMEQANDGLSKTQQAFFKQFKALTLLGYYTSEIGATQELAYAAIPGAYIGNYPFEQIGKAWAL